LYNLEWSVSTGQEMLVLKWSRKPKISIILQLQPAVSAFDDNYWSQSGSVLMTLTV